MSRVRNLVDFTTLTHDFDGDGTLDFSVTGTLTGGAVSSPNVPEVDLTIAPEILEIQVSAPQAGQDTAWLWTWEQSTLPYARRTITNSPEVSVPLYKQGQYVINNFAAYDLFDDMTQTHTLYIKWIDGAGSDNLVSWATSTGPISDSHPDINGGNATDVQRITVNVPATITLPTLTAPSVSYTVTNNGAGAYTFSGAAKGDNPNLGPFYRGGTYTINITATGHPFYFTTDNGTNFTSGGYFGEYTDGVTGSRTDSGTITFTVPGDAPDTLYYQCGNHGVMRGAITVKDLAIETNINGNYVIYAQHTQEGHKTPIELRPIPSLVNQMCIVYDASVNKFVPQDLATYVENTPSFENKIREVAGTAELVVEDGSAVIAKVNVYDDSTYLPLVGNNPGDQAFATDTDILYIWDGSAWQQAGAANTDDLAEGSTNLFYTDARVASYLSGNDFDTATNIVASITDSAPATLDTLNELAAALGDDPNFATTVTNSIADKLPLAGGTMTGPLDLSGGLDLNADYNIIEFYKADATTRLGYLLLRDDGPNYLEFNDTDAGQDFRFASNNSSIVTIKSNGNVGIGTPNPQALLDVSDSTSNEPQIRLTTATATNYLSIARDSSTGHYEFKSEENGSAISFHTDPDGSGSQSRLLIDRYGRTLIGDYDLANGYTPYGQLTVRKNVNNGTAVATNISDLNDATLIIHNQDTAGTGNKSALVFAHAGSPGIPSAIVSTKQNGNWRTHLSFYTNNITGGGSTGVMQEQMRIDHDGNVGIGTNNPNRKLEVVSDIDGSPLRIQGNSSITQMEFAVSGGSVEAGIASSAGELAFRVGSSSSSAEKLRFTSSGYYHFNSTGSHGPGGMVNITNGGTNTVSSNALNVRSDTVNYALTLTNTVNGDCIWFSDTGTDTRGSIKVTSAGTTYNSTSDRRLKDNINIITDGKEKLLAMNPVTHIWIDTPNSPQVHGFIAQEMQEIVPEAVSGNPQSDEMMSMDYGRITPVIVAALQDALREIEELKERINTLENK